MLAFAPCLQRCTYHTRLATRQLCRMASSWFPREHVPVRHISSGNPSSTQLFKELQLAELSSSKCKQRPFVSGATRVPIHNSRRSISRPATQRTYSSLPTTVDESREPIIVAASWLGAKQRPFSKYKQLWQSLGFKTILSARPPMTTIMVPAAGQLLAAKFTNTLIQAARQRPNAPILVHLFSGGGFIFMGWVFQILSEMKEPEYQDIKDRVRGIVLDSSPAAVTSDVSSRALVAAALGRPADGIETELPWLVKPTAAVVEGYLQLPFIKDALLGMESAWLQQAPNCPKLFLYSDADVLIQPGVVEGFMKQQEAAGTKTYCYKWSDSAHVDHYRKYPEEYKQQLLRFVQQVLPAESLPAAVGAGEQLV